MYRVERLTAEQGDGHLDQLVGLLQDAAESGASVGFLPPVGDAEGRAYWRTVLAAVAEGGRVLLAAVEGNSIVGTVQLDLARMANARHRAEVMKLMVHRRARRRGIGRALMLGLEEEARRVGRSLLVLDTRAADAAEQLYVSLGYTRVGVIPRYARSASGSLDDTVYFYREL